MTNDNFTEEFWRMIKEDRKKERLNRRKQSIKRRVKPIGDWFKNNIGYVVLFGPAIIGVLTTSIKVIGKNVNLKKQKNIKKLYCYDRSLGHYWALRRELTNAEWVTIDKRKKQGERLADILDELKVLK